MRFAQGLEGPAIFPGHDRPPNHSPSMVDLVSEGRMKRSPPGVLSGQPIHPPQIRGLPAPGDSHTARQAIILTASPASSKVLC